MDENEKVKKIMDKITLENLKKIIIICLIFSILFEFIPSIFNICELFNYCSFVIFLQPHKDFFTNIALGCLGSAVISYIMLFIPQKIKEQEKMKELSRLSKNVISDFIILYISLENIIKSESLDNTNSLERSIKREKEDLYTSIKNLVKYYEDANNGNNDKVEEIIDICQNKLLFAIKEFDIFFNVYDPIRNSDSKVVYPVNYIGEMYSKLYENLNRKFDLNGVKEYFLSIIPQEIAFMKSLSYVINSISNYNDEENSLKSHTYYSIEIMNINNKFSQEDGIKRLNEMK